MSKREFEDPRSVAFRAAVKGWSFSYTDRIPSMIERAKPHAWLPDHFETLVVMERCYKKESKHEQT